MLAKPHQLVGLFYVCAKRVDGVCADRVYLIPYPLGDTFFVFLARPEDRRSMSRKSRRDARRLAATGEVLSPSSRSQWLPRRGLDLLHPSTRFPSRESLVVVRARFRPFPEHTRPEPRRFPAPQVVSPRFKTNLAKLDSIPADPRYSFCARRARRRQVLFARQVAGRRGGSPGRGGRYRRSQNSQYGCGG